MAILITGGTGFVGTNLDGDFKISTKDVNLLNFEETNKYFAYVKPTTVIHAAAKHGNFSQIEEDKVGYYRENALISINVFEAARLNGVRNIIAFSSVTAFPDAVSHFSEEDLYKGEPHQSCYPYAYAKRVIEVLCRAYSEQYGLNYNCVFLANAYGPYGRDNVIPTLIEKCLAAHKVSSDLEVLGDGTPTRDFIFIEDVKSIINKLIDIPLFGPVILSSGIVVSIADVVKEIVRSVNFRGKVIWNSDQNIGQKDKIPSNKKLLSVLPNLEFSSLRHGIEKTVEWYVNYK